MLISSTLHLATAKVSTLSSGLRCCCAERISGKNTSKALLDAPEGQESLRALASEGMVYRSELMLEIFSTYLIST